MTPTITTLNSLNISIYTEARAIEIVSGLNTDTEDAATYTVEKKDHGYAIAVYEDDEFILYL